MTFYRLQSSGLRSSGLRSLNSHVLGLIFVVMTLMTLMTMMTGCAGTPGEGMGKEVLQNKLNQFFPGRFAVVAFKETKGAASKKGDVQYYTMEFKAEIKALKKPRFTLGIIGAQGNGNFFGPGFIRKIFLLKKDETGLLEGKLKFILKENGWEPD